MGEDKDVKRVLIVVIIVIGFIIVYKAGEQHGYKNSYINPTDYELDYTSI